MSMCAIGLLGISGCVGEYDNSTFAGMTSFKLAIALGWSRRKSVSTSSAVRSIGSIFIPFSEVRTFVVLTGIAVFDLAPELAGTGDVLIGIVGEVWVEIG